MFWGNMAQMGMDYATARFERWWYTKALPKLQYETIPAAKLKVSNWWKRMRSGEKIEQKPAAVQKASSPRDEGFTTIALPTDLDGAYRNYTINMTSEEAQKELFEAFVLQYVSMKKLQKLAHARIVDMNGNIVNGADVIGRLSSPAVLRSINQLLSQHPSLLDEWQGQALSEALGRKLIQDDHFVPIQRAELVAPIAQSVPNK